TLAVDGIISSTNAVTLSLAGAGVIQLAGANTYTGGTSLGSTTTLRVNNASALGTVTFTINGGTIDNTSAAAITLETNNVQAWNGNFVFTGTKDLDLGTGAVTLNAARTVTVNGGTLTVGGGITGAAFGITKAGAGSLVLNGAIGTTSGTVIDNAGTLTLGGNNTYSGGTTLASGATLNINAAGTAATNSAIGTGKLTVNGGIIDNTSGSAITLATNNVQAWNGNFTFAGSNNLSLGTGAVSFGTSAGTARTITTNANTLTIGGVISNGTFATGLTKAGAGNLTLSGTNTFTGATIINGGTLTAAGTSGGALSSTSSITVNSGGTLLLGANDQIKNTAAITLAGGTFAKGNFTEGTATTPGVGALTLTAAGSHLDFGTGTVGTLNFASFSPGAFTLTVDNWTGSINTIGNSGTDRLIFDISQSGNLNNFSFTGYGAGATEIALGNGYYEITPITAAPEPSTYVAALLSAAAAGYHFLRRRRAARSAAVA
ncbi:MAG: autotransporter-associated beta strand repeat-containing protein, partial [Verrucomicrobiota bacterium]|nr:autotransporter-associated beta strand repeat-containing protein [Verrucomicrobiota bacterium]